MNKILSNSAPIFMRLLAGMAVLLLCAIVGVAIIVMLMVGTVWIAHMQLTTYGIDERSSALIIGIFLLASLLAIIRYGKKKCRYLRATSKQMVQLQPIMGGGLSRAFDSFMEGFSTNPSPPPPS